MLSVLAAAACAPMPARALPCHPAAFRLARARQGVQGGHLRRPRCRRSQRRDRGARGARRHGRLGRDGGPPVLRVFQVAERCEKRKPCQHATHLAHRMPRPERYKTSKRVGCMPICTECSSRGRRARSSLHLFWELVRRGAAMAARGLGLPAGLRAAGRVAARAAAARSAARAARQPFAPPRLELPSTKEEGATSHFKPGRPAWCLRGRCTCRELCASSLYSRSAAATRPGSRCT